MCEHTRCVDRIGRREGMGGFSPVDTATHCNTLHRTSPHCNTLQHAAHCITLQRTASQPEKGSSLVDFCGV